MLSFLTCESIRINPCQPGRRWKAADICISSCCQLLRTAQHNTIPVSGNCLAGTSLKDVPQLFCLPFVLTLQTWYLLSSKNNTQPVKRQLNIWKWHHSLAFQKKPSFGRNRPLLAGHYQASGCQLSAGLSGTAASCEPQSGIREWGHVTTSWPKLNLISSDTKEERFRGKMHASLEMYIYSVISSNWPQITEQANQIFKDRPSTSQRKAHPESMCLLLFLQAQSPVKSSCTSMCAGHEFYPCLQWPLSTQALPQGQALGARSEPSVLGGQGSEVYLVLTCRFKYLLRNDLGWDASSVVTLAPFHYESVSHFNLTEIGGLACTPCWPLGIPESGTHAWTSVRIQSLWNSALFFL